MNRVNQLRELADAVACGETTTRDLLEIVLRLVEVTVENTEATLRLCDKLAERGAVADVDRVESRK